MVRAEVTLDAWIQGELVGRVNLQLRLMFATKSHHQRLFLRHFVAIHPGHHHQNLAEAYNYKFDSRILAVGYRQLAIAIFSPKATRQARNGIPCSRGCTYEPALPYHCSNHDARDHELCNPQVILYGALAPVLPATQHATSAANVACNCKLQ